MKLSELRTGERAVIVKVNGHGSFRKRIIEMGFVKGNKVKVILNAPLRDPIEYEIIGYKISLRREEASNIEVISETEAKQMLSEREALPALDAKGEAYLEREMTTLAEARRKVIKVALVGNPNCGKTSLFNIASGSHEHVGNYSGVTVDAKEGTFEHGGYKFLLVDLPGTYSLSAYSPEELYVRKNLVEDMPDVVVNVVDASNLQRNLYLTTQLIDMNLRVVMALNMYDELQAKGDKLDIKQLGYLLGMPVVPTVSRTGKGIDELFDTVVQIYEKSDPHLARHIHINHGAELEHSIDRIKTLLQKNTDIRYKYSTRYLAIKYLENDKEIGITAKLIKLIKRGYGTVNVAKHTTVFAYTVGAEFVSQSRHIKLGLVVDFNRTLKVPVHKVTVAILTVPILGRTLLGTGRLGTGGVIHILVTANLLILNYRVGGSIGHLEG